MIQASKQPNGNLKMSAAQQAKAKRRQMRNGYAHLGNALGRRPRISGVSYRSVAESIARARATAVREANAKKKKG